MKKRTQNVLQKLVQDSFLKEKQNWAYLWINNLNIYTVCFYCMSELSTTKLFGNDKLWVSKTIYLLLSCMCESYSEHICLGSSHFWLTALVFTSHWRRGKSKLTKTHINRAGFTQLAQPAVHVIHHNQWITRLWSQVKHFEFGKRDDGKSYQNGHHTINLFRPTTDTNHTKRYGTRQIDFTCLSSQTDSLGDAIFQRK